MGAPEAEWRIMMMSALSASMLRAVSRRVSPLDRLLAPPVTVIVSALSRLAATSKASRVGKMAASALGTMDAPLRLSASGRSRKCPETMRRNKENYRGFNVPNAT